MNRNFYVILYIRLRTSNDLCIELNICTVVTRVAVMAMKFMISDTHIRSHQAITKARMTHATFETFHMIKQS
jgi:hypothetical protein